MPISFIRRLERKLAFNPSESDVQKERMTMLAATSLLLEAAQADQDFSEEELEQIRTSLITKFGMLKEDIDAIISEAKTELEAATCLHQITSVINSNWDIRSKVRLIEVLWRVVLSDSKLDPHERHLMSKLQGLLHIPQSEFIAAKLRVQTD